MNSAAVNAILIDAARLQITLEAHEGRLRFNPRSAVPDALLAQLTEHKLGLITVLTIEPLELVPVCFSCGGRTQWRLQNGSMWVCPVCHPPLPALDAIEVVVVPSRGGRDA